MLTQDVRKWIEKVDRGQYSYEDAMYEFAHFVSFLTKEEINMIKNKIKSLKT